MLRADDRCRAVAVQLALFAAWAAGCAPLGARGDGSLSVTVRDLPSEVDSISATVFTPVSERSFDLTPADGAVDLFVESVPSGAVEVRADAFAGGRFIGLRSDVAQVRDGAVSTVVLSFAPAGTDGGIPMDEHVSPILVYTVPRVEPDDVRGSDLVAEVAGGTTAFTQFLTDARAQLGREPTLIRMRSATLTLAGKSAQIVGLTDVFSSVDLIVDADEIESNVGTTSSTSADTLTLDLQMSDTPWLVVTSALLAADFDLRLRGPSPRSDAESFYVDLVLSAIFVAH